MEMKSKVFLYHGGVLWTPPIPPTTLQRLGRLGSPAARDKPWILLRMLHAKIRPSLRLKTLVCLRRITRRCSKVGWPSSKGMRDSGDARNIVRAPMVARMLVLTQGGIIPSSIHREISRFTRFLSRMDKVSVKTASWFPKCYKKSDGSQDAHRWSPDIPN